MELLFFPNSLVIYVLVMVILAIVVPFFENRKIDDAKTDDVKKVLSFDFYRAKKAIEFAAENDFMDVLNSKLKDPYKTFAFQYLAEKQLKVCADSIFIASINGNDINVPFNEFFRQLNSESEYEIFPLICENKSCIKFFYNGRNDLREKVVQNLRDKIGIHNFDKLRKDYLKYYPNFDTVPVAHFL